MDVKVVGRGIGYDQRIGTQFLNPGIGYGGSCFPKDVRALEQLAVEHDYPAPLLHAVEMVNRRQVERTVAQARARAGRACGRKTVAVLGLAFKPNTDDLRDAPAIAIIRRLLDRGAAVRAHDPIANAKARDVLGSDVVYCDDMYGAARGSHALVLATEWNEFKSFDFARARPMMAGDLVFDGRNIFDADAVTAAGFRYLGIGRERRRRGVETTS